MGDPPHPIPGIKGLSWLAEEQTSNFPPSWAHSQAQPDPNLVAAAFEKVSLKEFTVAPNVNPKKGLPFHQWWIEFDEQVSQEKIKPNTSWILAKYELSYDGSAW